MSPQIEATALEAAVRAFNTFGHNMSDNPPIEAAIRAYLASQEAAAPSEEPVAWQYRYRMWNTGDWSAWSVPTLDKSDSNDEWEWRPLFASPAVAPVADAPPADNDGLKRLSKSLNDMCDDNEELREYVISLETRNWWQRLFNVGVQS